MDESRKHQVSLRGASAKEISRDALLEKVSQEREQRIYARRAAAAAIFIQRVWRRYNVVKHEAVWIRAEWEAMISSYDDLMTGEWISKCVLRPFLFFIACLSTQKGKISSRDLNCLQSCFKVLLESVNSTDPRKNVCSLAIGTLEERRRWTYQMRKIVTLCFFMLAECDGSHVEGRPILVVTSLALRLVVVLTDLKGWKVTTDDNLRDADVAVKDLICFLGSEKSGLYASLRRYISKLDPCSYSKANNVILNDDTFLITASAITLAMRPFNVTKVDIADPLPSVQYASEQYSQYLLTTPWLVQRLPAVLLPTLKHMSILGPCLRTLLISRDTILAKMADIDKSRAQHSCKVIPPVGWALANILCLAAGTESDFMDSGRMNQAYGSYVHVVNSLAEYLLAWLDKVGWTEKEEEDSQSNNETSGESSCTALHEDQTRYVNFKMSYMDLFRPVCQQWHLKKLLAITSESANGSVAKTLPLDGAENFGKLQLLDIVHLYSYMLRIFAIFSHTTKSLPVLNMLSFAPGFLSNLWGVLESSLFPSSSRTPKDSYLGASKISRKKKDGMDRKLKQISKDGSNKWRTVLHKFTGKSQADDDLVDSVHDDKSEEDTSDVWDVESLRRGPLGISKEISCLLHLFCATYSHLLLVLDDIEFYEKQVPFTLEQQRRIASMLNTLVYNGLSHSISPQHKPLMGSAIRCLHLIYERDCRHQFCPPALWLSPARKSRPPVAAAARTFGVSSSSSMVDDASTVQNMGSVVSATPHVFPFEERVQMFREFINMDKVTRKMAGEVAGPGSRAVEIVVRRGRILEDGFRQLNNLGSRLKSSIHVSFVSECGLPEAGLDYGGLSKEFLTDISKEAFSPEYSLFSQTSTSDRLLIPNSAARFLENGMQMIEFIGRIVGKALYEGILLDYSFSHAFVHKLLGRYSFLDELSELDPELYKNLMYVKHYEGDVTELCLDFTVTEESFGKRHIIELKPGGKDVNVTDKNKMQYIHAMADYKLNRQILPFSNAFYRGLTDVISPSWLKLFNASEFNQLLSGGNYDIDVDDLKNNTRYTGGYSEGSQTVKLFWEVMKSFEPNERCMVLKFVTSCSRAPLLGFKYLQPSFTIHKVTSDAPLWATIGGRDVERLPSASTCYNTLKLPTYKRSTTLRAKLLYAINSNAGFELS